MHIVGQQNFHQYYSYRPGQKICTSIIAEFLNKMPPLAHRLGQAPKNASQKDQKNNNPDDKKRNAQHRLILMMHILQLAKLGLQHHGHKIDEGDHSAGNNVVGLLLEVGERPAPPYGRNHCYQHPLHRVL